MSDFVVDATVLVQASIDAAGLGVLEGHHLIAPPLAASEALSVLHEMKYRAAISGELATAALERLMALEYEVTQPENLRRAAWDIAESLGWAKTYDAEYVAVARSLGLPLVTLDGRLKRGASAKAQIIEPAEVIGRDEPD